MSFGEVKVTKFAEIDVHIYFLNKKDKIIEIFVSTFKTTNLLPSFFAVQNDLFEDENDEETEHDHELGHRVVDLRVVCGLNFVQNVIKCFVDV